jgi:hypothetical protein
MRYKMQKMEKLCYKAQRQVLMRRVNQDFAGYEPNQGCKDRKKGPGWFP